MLVSDQFIDKQQEEKVLGLLLTNYHAYFTIVRKLRDWYFFFEGSKRVLCALNGLISDNIRIDKESIATRLGGMTPELEFSQIFASHPVFDDPQEAASYLLPEIEILRRLAIKRRATETLGRVQNDIQAAPRGSSATTVLEATIADLTDILRGGDPASIGMDAAIERGMEHNRRVWNGEIVDWVPSGIKRLDEKIQGFRKRWLTLVGAITSKGKTAMVTSIIERLADTPYSGLFISAEQDEIEIVNRVLAARSGRSSTAIGSPQITAIDRQAVEAAAAGIDASRWHICDKRGITIEEIVQEATAIKAASGLDIVFIDYFQDIEVRPSKRENTEIVNEDRKLLAMRKMADTLNVAVVCLSQFNAGAKDGEVPELHWLRGTRKLSQTPDAVWMIWSQVDGMGNSYDYAVRIAKMRGGDKNYDVKLDFNPWVPVWK